MARGVFIAIEGGDGVGKDTQIELLKKEFNGPQFLYTREPGGTALGKVLREMLLHESYGSLPLLTEVCLFLADRAQHAAEVVAPALRDGKIVISNRSWISMLAYQLWGRDRLDMRAFVEPAIAEAYRECPLDRAIILDLPPEVGLERQRRMGKQFDVMENMGLDARERVRRGFLEVSKQLPAAAVVDADQSMEEVCRQVRALVIEAAGISA